MVGEVFPIDVRFSDVFCSMCLELLRRFFIPVQIQLAVDNLERFGVYTGNLAGR